LSEENLIPLEAIEKVIEYSINGGKESAHYYLDGEKIAYRAWSENQVSMEYSIKNQKMHGLFRTWHDNGNLCTSGFYIDGREHGITKQYDYEGNLIGSYEMHHGTGVDLWYSAKNIISEERYFKNGKRHGYERWWNNDNKTVGREQHFKDDVEHGIYREWNKKKSLSPGFPQYYVNGQKVSKKQYLKACTQDDFLPKFQAMDNYSHRELPFTHSEA
jgi:antitoxin component YwqK of YwqJK toxin-antitoxin module